MNIPGNTTHTYAGLEVSDSTYEEIHRLLEAAGYQHAFHAGANGQVIDMHGIALCRQPEPGSDADGGQIIGCSTNSFFQNQD